MAPISAARAPRFVHFSRFSYCSSDVMSNSAAWKDPTTSQTVDWERSGGTTTPESDFQSSRHDGGQSIVVRWSESSTGKFRAGMAGEVTETISQVTENIGQAYQMSVYVSSAGRPFVRSIQGTMLTTPRSFNRSISDETAPGQPSARDHVNFEGRSIVIYREFESGARRIGIDFDGANTICKATVINGRRLGDNLARPYSGRTFEASSVQIGAVSCSIQEGNVFAQ
jgi:hypothetical protein